MTKEMAQLRSMTQDYVSGRVPIASMEKDYLRQVLSLCLSLLGFVIKAKQSALANQGRPNEDGKSLRNKGDRTRKYLSLFGLLEFSRPSYYRPEIGMVYPLDEELYLPQGLWSYNIQEFTARNASEVDFRESVSLLNQVLGLNLNDPSSERNVSALSQYVDAFYESQTVASAPPNACFCASFDGKGVPKINPAKQEAAPPSARLGKGQKRGTKQMATVGVMSWVEPVERDKSSILKALMREFDNDSSTSKRRDNGRHQAIHRRAFLADQEKAIAYGLANIKQRINHPEQRLVVPIDAGIGLEDKVLEYIKKYELENHFEGIILDFIHVSEYVWDSANALLGETSQLRHQWVRDMLEDLLDSKTTKVIADLQKIVDKNQSLSDSRREKIGKAITYFTNHQHKMDYARYLKKGYPITSAIVESNCKHLVKDRMEQSGMRWSSQGAQAMMDIRATKLNGDLPQLIQFVDQQHRGRIKLHAA